jgi:hypothetical protein
VCCGAAGVCCLMYGDSAKALCRYEALLAVGQALGHDPATLLAPPYNDVEVVGADLTVAGFSTVTAVPVEQPRALRAVQPTSTSMLPKRQMPASVSAVPKSSLRIGADALYLHCASWTDPGTRSELRPRVHGPHQCAGRKIDLPGFQRAASRRMRRTSKRQRYANILMPMSVAPAAPRPRSG